MPMVATREYIKPGLLMGINSAHGRWLRPMEEQRTKGFFIRVTMARVLKVGSHNIVPLSGFIFPIRHIFD